MKIKPAPRVGATFAIDSDTVLRGGYGLFWAPWNYNTTQHGQIGFARSTGLNQTSAESEVPITVLDNPFPTGLLQPAGSSLGLLTGVGGTINFIDQTKGSPKVHQYSVDIQRELPGNMAVTIGYIGATGRDIGFCGTVNAVPRRTSESDLAWYLSVICAGLSILANVTAFSAATSRARGEGWTGAERAR